MSRVSEILKTILSIDPEAPAIDAGGQWHSWKEIAEIGANVEAELQRAGLGEEARVGVLLRNRPAFVAVVAHLTLSRRCLVTLNPVYPDERVAADILEQATPIVILSADDMERAPVRDALAELGSLVLQLPSERGESIRLVQSFAASANVRTSSPGVAIEMLTSGTTGKPKRVPLQREQFEGGLLRNFEFEKGRSAEGEVRLRGGVQIITAPLAHISGILGIMNCLLAGRKSCVIERFTVSAIHDAIVRHEPRVLGLPPAALRMLYDSDIPREDLKSVQVFRSGTAPLDPDLADALYEKFGIPVLQNYGATEFGGVAGWTLDDFKTFGKTRRGSVGRMNTGVEARIADPETFEIMAPGETGLLELRSKDIGDGKSWLRTSDLASLDAEGFLWIRGRADNAIIRGGFKVHPDRVTKAIEQHEAIKEACVVGLKDPRLGQVPAAGYTVWSGAQAPSDEDLVTFLRANLAPYEVPVLFRKLEDFPRTISLKVDQPALAKLLATEGTA